MNSSQAVMLAVKSGNVEIKHGDLEVGQIKLGKWVSKRQVVHGRARGQQRNIMKVELEHEDNCFSPLKIVLVIFLLHWTQHFVAWVKGKMRRGGKQQKKKRRKVVTADIL